MTVKRVKNKNNLYKDFGGCYCHKSLSRHYEEDYNYG